MKKKWIGLPFLLLLGVIGVVAPMSGWQHVWDEYWPWREVTVDRALRDKTIDILVAKLNDHYVFPDKARKFEALVRQRQQEGRYDGIRDGKLLARRLRADLDHVARDAHMKLWFEPRVDLPDEAVDPLPATQAEWEQRSNFVERLYKRHAASAAVKKPARLDHDIGYLKLSSFPEAVLIAERFGAAMDELADTDGLIVDLRGNGGGDSKSVALLLSYFVDGRTRLNDIWDRETGKTTQHWTEDKLDGKRYGGTKPVLVLVDRRTASAGEDFAYTMQALRRATVVGERTWGGAHPVSYHRIGEHFFAVIPNQRSISPVTGTNWEGVGVAPDVAATSQQALAVAKGLLRRRLQGGAPLAVAGR